MSFKALLLLLLAGCATVKLEGECLHTVETKITYHCPSGTLETWRALPLTPTP